MPLNLKRVFKNLLKTESCDLYINQGQVLSTDIYTNKYLTRSTKINYRP